MLVVDGGFAGYAPAKTLCEPTRDDVGVIVVARENYSTFRPLAPGVISSDVEGTNIARPLRRSLITLGASFRRGSLRSVDLGRRLARADGKESSYDHLVLALGEEPAFFGVPGVREHALAMKDLPDAERIRDRAIDRFGEVHMEGSKAQPSKPTFVVVHGGATGVETAAEPHTTCGPAYRGDDQHGGQGGRRRAPRARRAHQGPAALTVLEGPAGMARHEITSERSQVEDKDVYILYHAGCDDGFGAAWAAWKALGERAEYLPVAHGEPPPELPPDATVYLLDFSYPRDVLLRLRSQVRGLTVLDHHETTKEELVGLDFVTLDTEKSGAVLAWEFWHPDEEPPPLVRYLEDADLWRFELPKSREIAAALEARPYDFTVWDRLDVAILAREGASILPFRDRVVDRTCEEARLESLGGHEVPVVNATAFWSEVGHRLLERFPEAPFSASYRERKDGRRVWSLRSRGDFDVSEVAEEFGGGGRRTAAGFMGTPGHCLKMGG